ncbi:hypothetical protein [Tengunoibacter tsumagoiensis]|uniref:Uncharacterized protein n=1 Tax=Tengunoibacter tsumagoiensis TaxID=2014871 RepID=A0A402A433_9CHLR|nr:hypothetical protein [Tengunoibacter tsumagoiensis]GCE13819.1 hypothetical protein KTT_36780 [Tengunoibacter tsumagoiensis]
MPTSKEERNRILSLVENQQLSALEAAQLLDTLEWEQERPVEYSHKRVLRVLTTRRNRYQLPQKQAISIPINFLHTCLRLGIPLFPQLGMERIQELLQAIEKEPVGRLLDLQDLDQSERVEVYLE